MAASRPAIAPPAPLPGTEREVWMLDPGVVFLNHGSFGARLHRVFARQMEHRRALEAQPVAFLGRDCRDRLAAARAVVGRFLGMDPDGFGFVTNATEGVNAVLRGLRLSSGDRIVSTTHVYHAVRQTMRLVAREADATFDEIALPLPVASPGEVVERVVAGLDARTRLLVIDHVTSPTALVLPVEEIVAACRARGVRVLVDGAHAPGMLELHVASIGADWYAGNLHKWVASPPGAAFLWAAPEHRATTHPVTISHFLDEGFRAEFEWQGTRDVTAWLAAADAIQAMDALAGPDSWPRIRAHNRDLATWVRARLADAWGVTPIDPDDGTMRGSMTAVPLPPGLDRDEPIEAIQARLLAEHAIEIPCIEWQGHRLVRASCQVYNRVDDYERLVAAGRG